jgi:hypothetical protein
MKFWYYLNLFFKKLHINTHNIFEQKSAISEDNNYSNFKIFLISNLYSQFRFSHDGIYVNTKVKNNNKSLLLTQARTLLILSLQNENSNITQHSKWLIENLSNYIVKQRNKDQIYTFNYPSWDRQDEGIATVWALISLIKSYPILKVDSLLNFIIETSHVMLDKLYSKETSLMHTKDDKFWCLNAASTLAWFLSELMIYSPDKKFSDAMNNSILLCLKKISPEGYFPYSEKRHGTYILLYNPVVIYTLNECQHSNYLDDNLKKELYEKLTIARNYLVKQMDSKCYFIEPEVKNYSRYIVSNITSLVSLKGFINKETENQILQNIFKFLKKNELFLCINDDYKLYNSSLFKLKDQLSIEVLYWLETYEKLN